MNIKTPCFIYDIDILNERVNYLKKKLSNGHLVFAIKANSFIVKELESLVDRFEICSEGEFDIMHHLAIDHQKYVISGVYKSPSYVNRLIKNYDDILKYTIESKEQYKLLCRYTKKYQRKINVLIRLTSENQFGVSETDFKKILKLNEGNEYICITGIEYFSGTQKHNIKKLEKEINRLNDFVKEVENEYHIILDEIEYGPGLPIFYFQDEEFDEDDFLTKLNDLLKVFEKHVYLEIGRGIAASCGSYYTKVVDLKKNKFANTVILDGGINQLVYYGQTMAMRLPFYDIISKRMTNVEKNYTLYGSLCTINDIIIKNLKCRKLFINDLFVFKNVGAYSVTEGLALFLSHDLPRIYLKKDNGLYLVRNFTKTSKLNLPKY